MIIWNTYEAIGIFHPFPNKYSTVDAQGKCSKDPRYLPLEMNFLQKILTLSGICLTVSHLPFYYNFYHVFTWIVLKIAHNDDPTEESSSSDDVNYTTPAPRVTTAGRGRARGCRQGRGSTRGTTSAAGMTLWDKDVVTAEYVVVVYDVMTAEDMVVDAVVPEGPALAEEVVVAEDVLQVEAMVLCQVMEDQQA